jgi:Pyridoxamine 5'-phosphate oxidase like
VRLTRTESSLGYVRHQLSRGLTTGASRPPVLVLCRGFFWVFRFIAQNDSAVTRQADGKEVNLSVMDGSTYISLSGTGRVERDVTKKRELWDRLTEACAGEPEDPANIILEVSASVGEYWQGGNPVANIIGLAKAALTKKRPDNGDHGTAQLS